MFDGPSVARTFRELGVTHVVWIPDSELGTWESALSSTPGLMLVRATREGEAIAIAGGLLLGGKRPVVAIQCTGLFEAGDALRNIVHDLRLPLFLIAGLRSYYAYQNKATADTCPVFAEPILQAWRIPYRLIDRRSRLEDLTMLYRECLATGQARVALYAE